MRAGSENPETVFGFLGPEVVHFVEMREALIVFWSKGRKTAGATIKVRFSMPDTKAKKVDIAMRVVLSRPNGKKGYITVGMAHLPEDKLRDMRDLLATYAERPAPDCTGRRSPRLPISLRVMGRDLPGFGAVTVDISQHGTRLNCHGLLKPGLVTLLGFESDNSSVENMQMKARCIWSEENKELKGYLAGMEFIEMTPAQEDVIDRYCRSLAGRLKGDVMHRQIADGELTVRQVNEDAILPAGPSKGAPPPPGLPKGPPPPPNLPKGPPPPPVLPKNPPPPPPQR